MAQEPKGNENEIGRWIEESISDKNIAKWIKIWCEDQSTFIECAQAFPNGSKDLLDELNKKQNGQLIEKQRAAIGKLFAKVESARNAQRQMDFEKLSNEIHNLSKKVENFAKLIKEQNRLKYNFAQLDNMSDATCESGDLGGFKDIVKSGYKFKNGKCQITGTEEDAQFSDIWKDVVKPYVNDKDESQVFYRLYSGKFDSIQVKARNIIVGAHIVGGKNTFVSPRNGLLMTKLFSTFFDLEMFTLIPKDPLKPSDGEYKVFVLYYRSSWEKENNIQNNIKSPDEGVYHKISLPSGSPKLCGQYWFPHDAIEQLYKFDGATLEFYGSQLRPYSRALKHHCQNSTKNATIKKWIDDKQAQILDIQFI